MSRMIFMVRFCFILMGMACLLFLLRSGLKTVSVPHEKDIQVVKKSKSLKLEDHIGRQPFELITSYGESFTNKDLLGSYSLVFFGYTYCPDICPNALEKMTKIIAQLNPYEQAIIKFILITVDPLRDTPKVLREYMSYFDSHIIALTGEKQNIDQVLKSYHVYSQYRSMDHMEMMKKNKNGHDKNGHDKNSLDKNSLDKNSLDKNSHDKNSLDMLMNHSGLFYLMDPSGHFVKSFSMSISFQELLKGVQSVLKKSSKPS